MTTEKDLQDIKVQVARTDERTDHILQVLQEVKEDFRATTALSRSEMEKMHKRISDNDRRTESSLNELRKRQNWMAGAGSAGMAILGLVIAAVGPFFGK